MRWAHEGHDSFTHYCSPEPLTEGRHDATSRTTSCFFFFFIFLFLFFFKNSPITRNLIRCANQRPRFNFSPLIYFFLPSKRTMSFLLRGTGWWFVVNYWALHLQRGGANNLHLSSGGMQWEKMRKWACSHLHNEFKTNLEQIQFAIFNEKEAVFS